MCDDDDRKSAVNMLRLVEFLASVCSGCDPHSDAISRAYVHCCQIYSASIQLDVGQQIDSCAPFVFLINLKSLSLAPYSERDAIVFSATLSHRQKKNVQLGFRTMTLRQSRKSFPPSVIVRQVSTRDRRIRLIACRS